ncbi:hypothetical protein PENVUL_c010G01272 [Penicillium vulpinum]|uniref:Telomere replication protein EST3 n=1 Tax=Penicillium vulpinum TaxID=29845 RepID=A0A1V6S2P5_9EURO|nr:hypothetical protein PENVUL_c010G01272 [Penicillium vulpinum]
MSPVSPWIAALADQCLSSYLGQNDQDEVEVKDFDGCLIFSISRPTIKSAVIVSWEQGENSHRATFTDSINQIDAIILRDSPDIQEATDLPPSVKGGTRHLVELSDIKLIFTYSAPAPDVCLHVNRFTIHRNAVLRGDVPKPKLKKTAALRSLMTMTTEKIRKTHGSPGSNSQTNTGPTDSIVSQRDQPMSLPQNSSVSQLPFSQPPSNMLHGALKGDSMANRASTNGSSDLLGLLAPSHRTSKNDAATRDLPSVNGSSLGESTSRRSPSVNRKSKSATNLSYAYLSQDVDNLIAEYVPRIVQSPNESDDHDRAHIVGTGDDQLFSKKRHRGSTDAPSQAAHDDNLGSQGPQGPNTSPSKKRQRIGAGGVMPADPTESEQVQNKPVASLPRVQIVSTKADSICPSSTNPWEGMTKIPLSEVDIPKDQAELLEGLKWIPQDPGVSTSLCHVPPHLLTQWNKIARSRQHLAEKAEEEEEEQVPERALTQTPPDTPASRISWSLSPDRTPALDLLPRDTASPPRYIRPTRKSPTPRGTQYSVDKSIENVDLGMVNGSYSASSLPRQRDIIVSKDNIEITGQRCSQSAEQVPTKPKHPLSLDHGPGDDPSQTSKSLDVVGDKTPILSEEHSHDEQPAEIFPFKYELRGESSGDESDEPEMETYVPFALGGSIPLSSQPEQEPTSSGPSLPRFARGIIQVVETPAVHTARVIPENQRKQRAVLELQSSQHPSSQAAKTSSSSRILNTYRSQDSHGQGSLSQEAPNPSLPIVEDTSLGVDVLGTQTQTSSVHAPSRAIVQSSSDIVLDSSRPAQRQRGSSIFHLDPSDDSSSFPYTRCHSLPMSQLHESSQYSSRGPLSFDGASQLPEFSLMEFTTQVAAHGESLSKCSPLPRHKSADTGQQAFPSPNIELVARRQGFIGKSDEYAEAQTIYEKFCDDYSSYSGDFTHFTEMCSKLQTMRQRGQLQRSFLWDDFIIQQLEEYPRYFAERTSQESKTMDYEDFFCSEFSRPRHKKRSLTAHGVESVACQFAAPSSAEIGNLPVPSEVAIQGEVTRDKAMQSEVANTSFTASLVKQVSRLHAQCSDDVPVLGVYMPTATQSSSFFSASTDSDSLEIKVEAGDSFHEPVGSQISTSSNDHKLVLSTPDEEMMDATQYDADNVRNTPDPDDVDMDEIDETQAGDDNTYHETASVELGEDSDEHRISPPPAPPVAVALGSLNAAVPEPPRQRRPWFRSIRKMFPTGPVWSDDPDTPFKRWARQDQNVLQELNRRGGARVLVDEKGVIRRPTYNKGKNPGL